MLDVRLPVRTHSNANQRLHWSHKARQNKKQRRDTYYGLLSVKPSPGPIAGNLKITITRLYPDKRSVLDADNLASSSKAVQDGIADWLGIDDGSPQIQWCYAQEQNRPWGVRVQIMELENADSH